MPFAAFTSAGITGWDVDYDLKVMRRNSAARMTVQAMYSGLMNEFDNSGEMNDAIPLSAQTPSEFTLINGWHIPEASMDYLLSGSIQTSGYNSGASANVDPIHVITLATVSANFISSDIGKTVVGATSGTGTLLSYNNTTKKLWVRVATSYSTATWVGNISTTAGTGAGTSPTAATGEDVWANFYTLGTYPGTAVMYIYQNAALVASYTDYTQGALDQLVKTKSSGSDIDSRNVTIYCRDSTYTFDNFTSQASATGGRNPVPIAVFADSNDSGVGVSAVTVTFGTVSKDIGDGNGAQNYDVTVTGGGTKTTLELYRYLKQIIYRTAAAAGTTTTLSGSPGTGYFYRYFNAGYTENKQASFALYAGGKIFGSRGIWIEGVTDMGNRVLIDAGGTTRTPPVSIVTTVTGVASGDRVLMARSMGSGSKVVNTSQFTLNGAHTIGAGTIVVNGTIPADTPTSGVIRVGDDRHQYASFSGSTFTLGTPSPALNSAGSATVIANYSNGAGAWVPNIDDTASTTSISNCGTMVAVGTTNRDVVIRARKYASGAGNSILPFENSGTVSYASGLSAAAIRTVDPVAT